jgi:hypothetical protein
MFANIQFCSRPLLESSIACQVQAIQQFMAQETGAPLIVLDKHYGKSVAELAHQLDDLGIKFTYLGDNPILVNQLMRARTQPPGCLITLTSPSLFVRPPKRNVICIGTFSYVEARKLLSYGFEVSKVPYSIFCNNQYLVKQGRVSLTAYSSLIYEGR